MHIKTSVLLYLIMAPNTSNYQPNAKGMNLADMITFDGNRGPSTNMGYQFLKQGKQSQRNVRNEIMMGFQRMALKFANETTFDELLMVIKDHRPTNLTHRDQGSKVLPCLNHSHKNDHLKKHPG